MTIQDKIRFDALSCKDEKTRKVLLEIAEALDKGYSLEDCAELLKKVLDNKGDNNVL